MNKWRIEKSGSKCRIILASDLTSTIADKLKGVVKAELRNCPTEITFDLFETVMLDSEGIGLLLTTHRALGLRNAKLRVRNVSDDIFHLLQSMRLTERFSVRTKPANSIGRKPTTSSFRPQESAARTIPCAYNCS